MNRCCICQKPNLGSWIVCRKCKDAYELDNSYALWPEWAKECARFENRERRHEQRAAGRGVNAEYTDRLFYG